MARTNPDEVANTFDTELEPDSLKDWIDIANDLVDDISSEDSSISSGRLSRIEKLLAQHLAASQDPRISSATTGNTEVSFQGETGMHLNATTYGQNAVLLDPTGVLQQLQSGKPQADISVLDGRDL